MMHNEKFLKIKSSKIYPTFKKVFGKYYIGEDFKFYLFNTNASVFEKFILDIFYLTSFLK